MAINIVEIFQASVSTLADQSVVTEPAWRNIVAAYGSPANPLCGHPRAYHNLGHIADCLREAQTHSLEPKSYAILHLALIYHDLVYDVNRKDNELASAKIAVEALTQLGVPESATDQIYSAVVATDHQSLVSEPLSQLVCDIDLSTLAVPQAAFQANSEAIRIEYRAIPNEIFYPGRKRIMEKFLERKKIYYTPFYQEHCEAKARENIRTYIAELETVIATLP
jgi:predicted metal-dependent HD superfamily phosphohydrolase